MDLTPISKAVAGGIVTGLVALVFRYTGHQLDVSVVGALGVIVTAAVGYIIGHVVVYFAPANKVK